MSDEQRTWNESDSEQFLRFSEIITPSRLEQMALLADLVPAESFETFQFVELGYGALTSFGTNAHTSLANFTINTSASSNPLVGAIAANSLNKGNLREEKLSQVYFTDDQAPVEQLIDSIILDAVTKQGN